MSSNTFSPPQNTPIDDMSEVAPAAEQLVQPLNAGAAMAEPAEKSLFGLAAELKNQIREEQIHRSKRTRTPLSNPWYEADVSRRHSSHSHLNGGGRDHLAISMRTW